MTKKELVAKLDRGRAAQKRLEELIPPEGWADPPELPAEKRREACQLWLELWDLVYDEELLYHPVAIGTPVLGLPARTRGFLAEMANLKARLAVLCESLDPLDEYGDSNDEESQYTREPGKSTGCISVGTVARAREWTLRAVSKSTEPRPPMAEVLEWEIFSPDEWWWNRMRLEIQFVAVSDKVPRQVHFRLREINRCALAGNWLALITLSRSTLEYALRDRLGPATRLEDLVDSARKAFGPTVADYAERIRALGNQLIHPRTDADLWLSRQGSDRQWQAQQVREILWKLRTIIEALYG